MVHVVMCSGIVPEKPFTPCKTGREKFKAKMPEHVVGNLIKSKKKQGVEMHGNNQYQYWAY